MKKLLVLLLIGTFVLSSTGCYGSFKLTKKLYKFNGSMGSKLVNSIAFWVMNIVPVYAVVGFVDIVFLNLVEYWTGQNPLSFSSPDMHEQEIVYKGRSYNVVSGKNSVTFSEPASGKTLMLVYDERTGTWLMDNGNESIQVARTVDDAIVWYNPDGTVAGPE